MKKPIVLAIALTMPALLALPTAQALAQSTPGQAMTSATANASFSEAQLDSLLAPIALYPDTLLSHVLIAATYPLEVVQADRWVRANPDIGGEDAVNAVDDQDWDPSVKALVAFPDLLRRMSEDLDWTQQLGDAFLADEGRVMDHVQLLRNKAYAAGNLDKMEHVKVVREERVITIEPSVEQVVYVPAYDTRVVYGNWWWAGYPPVYWYYPNSYVYVSGFYWSSGIYLGSSFYYSGCRWHDRRVVVVDRHYRPRHYSNRYIASYREARPWSHNPVHRRGVAYYDRPTSDRYHSSRESYRDSHNYRQDADRRDYRQGNQTHDREGDRLRTSSNPHVQPNSARDQRQGRLTANPHQLVGQSKDTGGPYSQGRDQQHQGENRQRDASIPRYGNDARASNNQVRQPVMTGSQTLPRISTPGTSLEAARRSTAPAEANRANLPRQAPAPRQVQVRENAPQPRQAAPQPRETAPKVREIIPQSRIEPRQERNSRQETPRFTRSTQDSGSQGRSVDRSGDRGGDRGNDRSGNRGEDRR